MSSIEDQINHFVNMIFTYEPETPKSYLFDFKGTEEQLNNILITILIKGCKKVFGESFTLPYITDEQFQLLNKYMQSCGYTAKREFKYRDDIIVDVRIWFEKLD